MLIGISGYAKSGKTTAAEYIERKYGVPRRHIADPLRDMLRPLLIANGVPADMIDRYLTGDLKESVIPEIGRTSRHLQISLGTAWGRKCVDAKLWARTWRRQFGRTGNAMNDSVRFPNEEDEIRAGSGFTILVRRPGTHPIAFRWPWIGQILYRFGLMWGVHDSERVDRLNPDVTVDNNGTLDALFAHIDGVMSERGVRACA